MPLKDKEFIDKYNRQHRRHILLHRLPMNRFARAHPSRHRPTHTTLLYTNMNISAPPLLSLLQSHRLLNRIQGSDTAALNVPTFNGSRDL